MGRNNVNAGSIIKSIQRGYYSMATGTHNTSVIVDTTISAVNLNKAHVYANNSLFSSLGYGTWQNTLFSETSHQYPMCSLVDSTTIRGEYTYYSHNRGRKQPYVAWQVVEYS